MVRGYSRSNTPIQAIPLFSQLLAFRFLPDDYIFPSVLKACSSAKALEEVFDKMLDPCVISYNAIFTGYAKCSRPNEALSLFRELQVKSLKPTDVAMLIIKESTALIDMYAKCGNLEEAICVFKNMSIRDTAAWSAMIVAYATHGKGYKAIETFEEMRKEGVQPDEITFLGLLYACSHNGLLDEGWRFFHSMSDKHRIILGIKHY
ncbi:pentatricopeptide repeat-containing protein At2g02980, chloroplastic-like [Hibiscus syriacus]|uniref:pentatricopeptide repeat-containing protein At2g02980, chloroplastic-like n=1 Tax=Hibiscus syriacus TaxID=106335 RepID=UPI001921813E|nr:pentatricopeptide repeat-containing protein At2g02980, chloroplastic-like [Hibiscus syriacus]